MFNNFISVIFNTESNNISYSLPTWLSQSPKLQVFNSIVMSNTIFMVDAFKCLERSAEIFFHYIAMLCHIFPIYLIDPLISIANEGACFIKRVSFTNKILPSTNFIAKVIFEFKMTLLFNYFFIAGRTIYSLCFSRFISIFKTPAFIRTGATRIRKTIEGFFAHYAESSFYSFGWVTTHGKNGFFNIHSTSLLNNQGLLNV